MQEHDILSKPYTFFVLPYILDKFLAFFFVVVLFFLLLFYLHFFYAIFHLCKTESKSAPKSLIFGKH